MEAIGAVGAISGGSFGIGDAIGLGSSLFGAMSQSGGVGGASDAYGSAINGALGPINANYQTFARNQQPYIDFGRGSLSALNMTNGMNPTGNGGSGFGGWGEINFLNSSMGQALYGDQIRKLNAAGGYAPGVMFGGGGQPGLELNPDGTVLNAPVQAAPSIKDLFTPSPGYQFALDQAARSQSRNASAGGYLNSGRQALELQNQAQGMANQEFNNFQNTFTSAFGNYQAQLSGIAGMGQNALGQMGSANSAYGSQISQLGQSLGTSNANASLQQGNIGAQSALGIGNQLSGIFNQGNGVGGFGGSPMLPTPFAN